MQKHGKQFTLRHGSLLTDSNFVVLKVLYTFFAVHLGLLVHCMWRAALELHVGGIAPKWGFVCKFARKVFACRQCTDNPDNLPCRPAGRAFSQALVAAITPESELNCLFRGMHSI